MPPPYPHPGSNSARILDLIQQNPGISVTGIKKALHLNSTPTKICLKTLLKYGRIDDEIDARGHHHYTAKAPVL